MNQLYWVIIPAYNEAIYLDTVLKKIKKIWPYFIVVNDGSKDTTESIAQKHTSHVLTHPVNLGKGAAMRTGSEFAFSHLKAKGVIYFDADDQHDASLIPKFVQELKQHDVVFGVRSFDNKMPLNRIMMNRLASAFILLLFGSYVPDIPCGFKALTKKAYARLGLRSRDYVIEMEIAARVAQYRLDYKEISIPTVYHDLDRGMTILDTISIVPQCIAWRLSS